MVLLSLTVDGSLTNPAIKAIDDPVIDPNNLGAYNSHWADGLTPKDPYINALYFEDDVLTALPPTTIYVGSLEFNLPDTLLLHDRAVAEGSPISVVVGRGQIHGWALGVPINSQALAVRGAIYRQLGLFSAN
jgi:triacylglycerol lipase